MICVTPLLAFQKVSSLKFLKKINLWKLGNPKGVEEHDVKTEGIHFNMVEKDFVM